MKTRTKRVLLGLLPLTGLTLAVSAPGAEGNSRATAVLTDASGATAGRVTMTARGGKLIVEARLSRPSTASGFHGFHIHTVGVCNPADGFASAGGHLGSLDGETHAGHDGEMPSLLVGADGQARLAFQTDRATLAEILDGDGSAVIVHEGADNYANIPVRYAPAGPDATTLSTGDAGPRLLCGVLQ
ncbi:hypothetical protein BH18ACT4_BH18ACT4_08550 [soil metagenome]